MAFKSTRKVKENTVYKLLDNNRDWSLSQPSKRESKQCGKLILNPQDRKSIDRIPQYLGNFCTVKGMGRLMPDNTFQPSWLISQKQ